MQKLLKSYVPKKPSTFWCGSAAKKEQLAAVVDPANGQGGDNASAAATTGSTPAGAGAGATAAGRFGGGGAGVLFRRLFCFAKCCGTPTNR